MIGAHAHEILDNLTGIANGCRTLPIDPGAPSIFQVTVRMADTTPYLSLRGDRYNSGAGLSEEAAWAAGLGEAVERYCLSAVRPATIRVGSWRSLPPEANALHPSEVALFAADQSAEPRAAFREDTPLGWLEGTSLVDGRRRLVPACLVHIPYAPLAEGEALIAPAISTGSASAPTREAAIVAGLYECIERDAVCIMWLNRLPVPRLTVDVDWLRRLVQERFERPNLDYNLFTAQLDIPAPTVVCLLRDRNFDPPVLCIGGACRLDPAQAALKAMIEAVQGWNWARYHRIQTGHQPVPASFEEIESFESRVALYACTDMRDAVDFLLSSEAESRLSAYATAERSASDAIEALVAGMRAAGTDAIVLDLTTPEIRQLGLHVVKVFAPALQQLEGDHRYRLLGGSRWREVPAKLGYRAAPTSIDDLNPYPHPYP